MTGHRQKPRLTERQAAFVVAYVETMNAKEAARRAGYADATAKNAHTNLLQSAVVVAAIEERLGQIKQRGEWTLRHSIPVAVSTLVDVARNSKDDRARVSAAREILDRTSLIRRKANDVRTTTSATLVREVLDVMTKVVDAALAPPEAHKLLAELSQELERIAPD